MTRGKYLNILQRPRHGFEGWLIISSDLHLYLTSHLCVERHSAVIASVCPDSTCMYSDESDVILFDFCAQKTSEFIYYPLCYRNKTFWVKISSATLAENFCICNHDNSHCAGDYV